MSIPNRPFARKARRTAAWNLTLRQNSTRSCRSRWGKTAICVICRTQFSYRAYAIVVTVRAVSESLTSRRLEPHLGEWTHSRACGAGTVIATVAAFQRNISSMTSWTSIITLIARRLLRGQYACSNTLSVFSAAVGSCSEQRRRTIAGAQQFEAVWAVGLGGAFVRQSF